MLKKGKITRKYMEKNLIALIRNLVDLTGKVNKSDTYS